MSDPDETEVSEAEVTIAGVSAEPSTVTLVHTGRDSGGVRRDFVQQVPVRDLGLARRVLSDLHNGDRAQVTIINEWRENGCDTYLTDFKRVLDVETASPVKNGAVNIVQNDITQITIPSVQNPKTKVKR